MTILLETKAHQMDFPDGRLPAWYPKYATKPIAGNLSKGYAVELFARSFTKALKGVAIDKEVKFQNWQRWLVNNVMECDKLGNLRYSNVTILIPRKNGKTFIMAVLVAYHLITAPKKAQIYSAASSRDQAKMVFELVEYWAENDPNLSKILKVSKHNHTINNLSTGAVYKALAADSKSGHGTGPYFMICDEIHTWDGISARSRDSGMEQYNSYVKGGADNPSFQIISISTAGNTVDDSLLGDLYKRGVSTVKDGKTGRYGFFCWEADDSDDPLIPETWRKANPSLVEGMLIEDNITEELEMSTWIGLNTFLRDRLNIWVDLSGDPYIQPHLWSRQKLIGNSVLGDRDREVTIGFDASKRGDSTAIVINDIETGELKVWKLWEKPENASEDWLIPREDVTASMKEAVEFYDVRAIYCDSFYYESEIDTWIKKFGWTMVTKIAQSNERKDKMAEQFRKDLVNESIWHNDEESMNRHISNVIMTANGSFRKPSDRRKIDIFVASFLANAARVFINANPSYGRKKKGRFVLSNS